MNILCMFAGQGYQDNNLFDFFDNIAIPTELRTRSISNPDDTQVIIGTYQLTLWRTLAPLLNTHSVSFAGYSLGEVVAFLASIQATAQEIHDTLNYRTQLMSALPSNAAYDLLYIHAVVNEETLHSICQEHDCAIAIVNSDSQYVLAGTVSQLTSLLAHLSSTHVQNSKFLNIHRPSHSPVYTSKRGLFKQYLNTLNAKILHYPIISPIHLTKIYTLAEEQELLDQELYTTIQWQKVCALIREYQYDLIIDLGPGDAMTNLLQPINSRLLTTAHFKRISGFLKVAWPILK